MDASSPGSPARRRGQAVRACRVTGITARIGNRPVGMVLSMGTDHDGQQDPAPREHTGGARAESESSHHMHQLFTTHSHSWRDVGLARELSRRAVKRARIQSLVLLPLLVAVLVIYGYREKIFGPAYDTPVRIVTFLALISLGWQFARDAGRALGPTLFRRMDPGTAGTVGFLLRLVTMLLAVLVALRIAGLGPRTLALGGAFTAGGGGPPGPREARHPVRRGGRARGGAARSRRWWSASRPSRRSATCSPGWSCSARGRSGSASGSSCRAAASRARWRAS